MPRQPARTRVTQARGLQSTEQARQFYRAWATDYDRDIADELKFTGSIDIARLLDLHMNDRSGRILDLGCGTGLVGAELQRLGFTDLDGLDLSQEMLQMANAKQIYRTLIEADLSKPLDIPDATYHAAVSAGTFTTGHVDAGPVEEILRVLKPGGLLACVIARDFWHTGGFARKLNVLQTSGQITLTHNSVETISDSEMSKAHYCVIVHC